jgi:LytS/YehU family sensor histidine kinase
MEALPGLRRLQAAALAVFVLVDVTAHVSVYGSFGVALGVALVLEPVMLGLAMALLALFDRGPVEARITPRILPRIVGLSLVAALIVTATAHALRGFLALEFDPRVGPRGMLTALIYYFLLFVIWSVICFWTRSEMARQAERERAAQAEAQAMRAELERLRLQVDPHFLFNALNGIGEEIPDNPDAALAMLRNLSIFLRQSLAGIDSPISTVAAEAEALSAYLRVQQARFGARLKLHLDVAPDAATRRLPSLLLQPLVENAIKHGRRDPVLEVSIAIRLAGEALDVLVTNQGALPPEGMGRAGIGLSNIRSRIALHYPGRSRFDLRAVDGVVTARLRLEGEPCSAP